MLKANSKMFHDLCEEGIKDGKKIKEDTYYALEDGKFVEKGAVEDD